MRASDILARNNHPLTWGPARHTIGHNCASYHHNPDGLMIELYAEMDQMLDEELGYYDPKPWHEFRPQRPRAWGPDDFAAQQVDPRRAVARRGGLRVEEHAPRSRMLT